MAHHARVCVAAIYALALAGCAAKPTPPANYPPIEAPPSVAAALAAPPPAPEAPAPLPAPPVQVVAAESTPLEGAAPTLQLRAPREGQLIKTDQVEVKLEVKNWALSPEGSHVHLIVDNEPYIAIRDVSKPIDLRALVQAQLGHDLAEGTHLLRAFPGRGHHESVKEHGAFDVKVFHFKTKSKDFKFDAKAPLLTFSRPKGCVDLGQRVLLDFYVTNTKLSATDSRVRVTIDGAAQAEIAQWTPHYIENLTEGEHELRLALVNAKGEPVAGLFNDTTRKIRIASSCKALTAAPAAATPTTLPTPASAAAEPACGAGSTMPMAPPAPATSPTKR